MIYCFNITSNYNMPFPKPQLYPKYLVCQIRPWQQCLVDWCSMKFCTQTKYHMYLHRFIWVVDPMMRQVPAFLSLLSRCWFSCIALQDQFIHKFMKSCLNWGFLASFLSKQTNLFSAWERLFGRFTSSFVNGSGTWYVHQPALFHF